MLAEYPANGDPASPKKEYGYRNGQLLLTATPAQGVSLQDVTWINGVGVSISGNNLTRTAASDSWAAAGAVSSQTISGDGYIEITATETNKKRAFGLTNNTSVTNYTHNAYGIHLSETGQITVHEGILVYGVFGTYSTGDKLRVAIEGGVVKYRKNGTLLRTSTLAPTYPLRAGAALYTNGSTVNSAVFTAGPQNVSWTNGVGVSISSNNLTRTAAGDAWSVAGAVSSQTIASGDGYVEITATETNKKRAFGLTTNTSVTNYPHNAYGIHLSETGQITIHEGIGVYGTFGTYATGDKLRVAIEGGVVKYRKNGTLLRTSTVAPTYPLRAGAALYTNGSTVNNAILHSGSGDDLAAQLNWLVTDHLGTPRIILDQTGSRANVKRHDYLPFGEELFAGIGGRTTALGYAGDGVRQQFTSQERDIETGLDYFNARYYGTVQARFTSPDPLIASGRPGMPQSWNRYAYVLNQPLRLIDPTGLMDCTPKTPCVQVPESDWLTVGPVIDAGVVTITPPSITEIFTSNEVTSEITPRPTAATNDCLYCGALSVEMHKMAVPMATVIETYAEIDLAIMTAPLAIGGGVTRLGLNAAGKATEAGAGGFDLALGLGRHVYKLADETGSLTYNQLAGSRYFSPENFVQFANQAKTIRFTTQGMDWARWGRWVKTTPESWSPYLQHVTNWELHQVLTNSKWLAKTVFY